MSINRGMDKDVVYIYIHTIEYYSGIKRNEIILSAATRMDLEMIILSKPDKYKYHMMSLTCAILKKKDTNKLVYKTETHRLRKPTMSPKEKGRGINWEFEINLDTLLYIKYITDKVLLYSTCNSPQYLVIIYKGKESEKECN